MNKPYSISLIALLKGVIYDTSRESWENLTTYESEVRKYFQTIGLNVYLDRSEGFAFLKQIDLDADSEIPRLIERRHLSYLLTLLCLILRKMLLENDAAGSSKRAIVTKQDIIERMKPFLPTSPDEAKQLEKIESQINKVIIEGFLREMEQGNETYEIRRIIKAFIDADKVEELLEKLKSHRNEKDPGTDV